MEAALDKESTVVLPHRRGFFPYGDQAQTYSQQGVQGYPQQQSVGSGGYNQQGAASGMYLPKPADVGSGQAQGVSPASGQRASASYSYSSTGAYGQQGAARGAQASGRYQQF